MTMQNLPLDQLPFDPDTLFSDPRHRLVEVTQSALSTFTACPQRFVFRYMMHLRKRGVNIALLTGSAVHKGFEHIIDPTAEKGTLKQRVQEAIGIVDAFYNKKRDSLGELLIGMEDKVTHSQATAHALIESWWIVHGENLLENYRIQAKEYKVRTGPEVNLYSPLLERMAGMIDGVVQDEEGRIWLLEHKTRQRLDTLNVFGLDTDFQALFYLVMSQYALPARGITSLSPVGFIYNAMQKPQHRLNHLGFSDLKERMIAAICDAPQKYFSLSPIPISEEVINHAMEMFRRMVHQMDNLSAETVYANFKACDDYGGCPYRTLCRNKADVAQPQAVLDTPGMNLYEFTPPHEELNEDGEEDLEKAP